MRTEISLVFPNQLFEESIIHDLKLDTYMIEENLFFKHFNFHKQKLLFLCNPVPQHNHLKKV